MSRVSKGVMEVTLNGNDYTLKATITAIESIEQRFGNMLKAAKACMEISFSDAVFIIAKGAHLNKEQVKQLKTDVLSDGIESGATVASEYLSMLLNPEEKESEESESGEE